MPEIRTTTLDLIVDGKKINVKTHDKRNFELNKALANKENFAKFVSNPRDFVKTFKLDIDHDISAKLSDKLSGIANLEELIRIKGGDDGGGDATVWAVAVGAYSMASTKIAVAF